jgi:hypothetical protein
MMFTHSSLVERKQAFKLFIKVLHLTGDNPLRKRSFISEMLA